MKRLAAYLLAAALLTAPLAPSAADTTDAPQRAEAPANSRQITEDSETKTALLCLDVCAVTYSGFANESALRVDAEVSGGTPPYTASVKISMDGVQVSSQKKEWSAAGEYALTYRPTAFGRCTFSVTVRDAAGKSKSASVRIPVALRKYETRSEWEASAAGADLTGDWREDLIAVARTQLGYTESSVNFVADAKGLKSGYTRYGNWLGSPYSDWCAAFVSFCLEYAGISAAPKLRTASVKNFVKNAKALDVYREPESWHPSPGDIVFLGENGSPSHMGIVSGISGAEMSVIEGNLSNSVQETTRYTNTQVTGYLSMKALMMKAGLEVEEDIISDIMDFEPFTAVTAKTKVILRSGPHADADKVATIAKQGTELNVLGGVIADSITWFRVEFRDGTVYVRGDLITRADEPKK